MGKTFILAALLSLGSPLYAVAKSFGDKITLKESTPLSTVVKDFGKYADKDLLTSGTVAKVCQKKGCWMTIKTDAQDVRVTFKDYKFFVPLNSAGQTARLQGQVKQTELSVEHQQHLLKDAGASPAQINAVKKPKTEYQFVASGVELGS